MNGYLHPIYANSFIEFGVPRKLSHSAGWILERQIRDFAYHDAMGLYPLFICQDWSKLSVDLEEIGQELVSLSLVTDPFGDYDATYLQRCFKDVVFPFKKHFVIDLKQSRDNFVCEHHHRNALKALKNVSVERCLKPTEHLDEWVNLYSNLIERHHIRGIAIFSRDSFLKQLGVPGLVAFRARYEGNTIGMLLWYSQDNVGYYHLGAYSSIGYKLRASFALFWVAIEYFAANGLRWLNLGAGAGVEGGDTDGLSRFKRGWSTGTRTAYFCGRIFNQSRYEEMAQAKGIVATDYFPAYRKGEFDGDR